MNVEFGHAMLEHWMLDPGVTYLNHGTVGAVPRAVLAAQQAIRDEMERRPSQFMLRVLTGLVGAMSNRRVAPVAQPTRMRHAAGVVAEFLAAQGDDVVFVDNATTGVNAVLRSLAWQPGDELLITDHT